MRRRPVRESTVWSKVHPLESGEVRPSKRRESSEPPGTRRREKSVRGTRVLEGRTEGATGQTLFTRRKSQDLPREERDAAHVVAQSLPPLED